MEAQAVHGNIKKPNCKAVSALHAPQLLFNGRQLFALHVICMCKTLWSIICFFAQCPKTCPVSLLDLRQRSFEEGGHLYSNKVASTHFNKDPATEFFPLFGQLTLDLNKINPLPLLLIASSATSWHLPCSI